MKWILLLLVLVTPVQAEMVRYNPDNPNTGIYSYEIGEDFVIIRFKSSDKNYFYVVDNDDIQAFQSAAEKGKGLNTLINKLRAK